MYEIKVLSNEEFDQLPESETRGSKISDSLGFANRFTGRAYVRQTGIHELNKYLINHELEELEHDDSAHEDENGIRHKKGPKLFKDIILPIFTGGITGGGGGGLLSALFGGGGDGDSDSQSSQMPSQQQQLSVPQGGSYAPSQGSYSPQGGSFGSPLNLFASQGSYTPSIQNLQNTGSYSPTLTQGMDGLPDEIKQKLSGNYSGRIAF